MAFPTAVFKSQKRSECSSLRFEFFTKGSRGEAIYPPKSTAEIAAVGETACFDDLSNGEVGVGKQLLGVGDPAGE